MLPKPVTIVTISGTASLQQVAGSHESLMQASALKKSGYGEYLLNMLELG